ncbi:MAG: DHA2 family efflux MFS transporter permease subunit [Patulibacter minatonensis]
MPSSSHPGRTLAACILASVLVFLDGSVVNVALPAIRDDLGGTLAGQQWIVEGFLLSLSALLLLGGSLGDLMGRHRVLIVGVLAFGATSLLCALAPSVELLVAGRILQGVAGALLVPVSLAIITATFAESERGAAIGTWTAGTSVSMIAGPFVGGFFVDQVSWRLIFAINVPLVLATLWLARSIVPDRPRSHVKIDGTGALLATIGLAGVIYALVEQPAGGWGAARVAVPGVVGVVALAAFLAWERRVDEPMLPLGMFRSRDFAAINLATVALYAPLGASTFVLSVFLQQVAGYSATHAGLALLPTTLVVIVAARRFGGLADRLGRKHFVGTGALVCAAAFALLLRVDADAPYLAQILPAVLVLGVGLSIAVAPLTATVLATVGEAHAGTASGINNAASRVAGLVAIAALGGLAATTFTGRVDAATRTAPAESRPALVAAREQPFVLTNTAPVGEQRAVRAELADASVAAYRTAMGAGAVLAALASLIAFAGLTSRHAAPAEPEPEPAI